MSCGSELCFNYMFTLYYQNDVTSNMTIARSNTPVSDDYAKDAARNYCWKTEMTRHVNELNKPEQGLFVSVH